MNKIKPIFHLLAMTALIAALGMSVYHTTDNGTSLISFFLFLLGTTAGFAVAYLILKLVSKK
ncbi:hypothetical protein SAMN05444266_10627 [Chitinophaga jiangningensis]|uniref:Uncharacterized protein n=1 Tax=Chitinophaga jiangningensis TaxID=1419482 RepID=A0A1M7F7N2_9BACT|nr:hypothetical protein SAMN05444266_10627 [Chitinophaga jiangningensis]